MSISHFSGPLAVTSVATLKGPGAVNPAVANTLLDTDGADALTLADGETGQEICITMIDDGGDGTLTPANLAGAVTQIVFDDVGDSVKLRFLNGNWCVVGQNGVTIS